MGCRNNDTLDIPTAHYSDIPLLRHPISSDNINKPKWKLPLRSKENEYVLTLKNILLVYTNGYKLTFFASEYV